MASFSERLERLRERIDLACEGSGRALDSVALMAVTKGHPTEICRESMRHGVFDLGENYVQGWRPKADELEPASPPPRWHFIGPLQRNKVKYLAGRIDWIHTLDRVSIIDELAKRWPADRAPLQALIQVNIAGEAQKSGCEPHEALALVQHLEQAPNIVPRGLMTIAPRVASAEAVRPHFRALRELRDAIRGELSPAARPNFTELSMGMSSDLEVAIEEGATWIRVGTALVGPRP